MSHSSDTRISCAARYCGTGKADFKGPCFTGGFPGSLTHTFHPTPISRRRAARRLGFDRGRWVVAYFSAYCSDCDKAAIELNKTAEIERVLGITIAPSESARKWKRDLGLKYPVISVSERLFEDLGAVILPTIVLFEDGEATGAYTPSAGDKK